MIPALARWNGDHAMTKDTTKEAAVAAEGLLFDDWFRRDRGRGPGSGARLHRDDAGGGTVRGVVASALWSAQVGRGRGVGRGRAPRPSRTDADGHVWQDADRRAFPSREAGRIRTAAKREDKISLEPSRHGTMRQASSGSLLASVLETGTCSPSRRMRDGGRPRPLQGWGGSGSAPGGQTLIVDCTPTT